MKTGSNGHSLDTEHGPHCEEDRSWRNPCIKGNKVPGRGNLSTSFPSTSEKSYPQIGENLKQKESQCAVDMDGCGCFDYGVPLWYHMLMRLHCALTLVSMVVLAFVKLGLTSPLIETAKLEESSAISTVRQSCSLTSVHWT